MGCVPSHKVESKETICSPTSKDKAKDKIPMPPRSKVIKSRFFNKMMKFKSNLNVIYEIPSEMEISVIKE